MTHANKESLFLYNFLLLFRFLVKLSISTHYYLIHSLSHVLSWNSKNNFPLKWHVEKYTETVTCILLLPFNWKFTRKCIPFSQSCWRHWLPGRDCLPVSQDGREGRFFPVFSGLFSQGTDSTDDGTLIIQVYCVTHVFLYSWLSSSFSWMKLLLYLDLKSKGTWKSTYIFLKCLLLEKLKIVSRQPVAFPHESFVIIVMGSFEFLRYICILSFTGLTANFG